MSATKFEQRLYKPEYDSQRPIIVDEDLGSPETAQLRYEEEALRANGGDYRGDSPQGLLPMATFKPQPAQLHAFADSPYSQYSTQSFSTQQTDNTTAQLNPVAYGTTVQTATVIHRASKVPPQCTHKLKLKHRPKLSPPSQPALLTKTVAHNGGPQLIRTSTLSSQPGGPAVGGGGYSNPYGVFPTKATLEINGDLDKMAEKWTQEEWDNRRRIVVFKKSQQGSHIQASFRAVPLAERPPNSICISCIYWAEKQECFVTSVDTIHLLEQLVVAPARFTVEEKNRIRRNLEGFHPLTVSKGKSESEEFFKVIMAFGNPKPRNIEKDVKVFRWKDLGPALKKIISKYSQSPSSTCAPPPSMPTPLLTPVSLSGSYPQLPPAPGSATTATDPASATGYITSSHHADSMPSPRSMSGIPSTWGSYPAPNRTISPGVKLNSPATSGYRVATLPAVYDPRTTVQHATSAYGVPSSSSHLGPHYGQSSYNQASMPVASSQSRNWDGRPWEGDYSSSRNWDGSYAVADGYSTSSRMHSTQTPVYSSGPSGDGTSRR
ncbi:Transcriptional regulator medusa [Coniochaeta hoffmannii]|uniref:Transcriptional regulator medusa n=1 Tax=Coniochaeta hoffmannii TaxID=91930 RepID=A0AA38RHX6_9PEZI|nr:Transcriptional regulator medusa [Coniochaeta hoffmannii]